MSDEPCQFCGDTHPGLCHRVKVLEIRDQDRVIRYEFRDDTPDINVLARKTADNYLRN